MTLPTEPPAGPPGDAGAAAEAEATRVELLTTQGVDANHSGEKIERIKRYETTIGNFRRWGEQAKSLRTASSSGPVTARAVAVFHEGSP